MSLSIPEARIDTDLPLSSTPTLINEAHPSVHILTPTSPTNTPRPYPENGGYMPLSLADNDLNLFLPSGPLFISKAHSSVHIPTIISPKDTTRPYTAHFRSTSLPNFLPPQSPHHPSPILYTQTMNRTHLQIYTGSDGDDDDSLILQGAQTDKLIFGGISVPSYKRRATSYISNSVLKRDGDERDELPACYWNDQWRNMKEGRARSPQTLYHEANHNSFSHVSNRSEGNETRVANAEGKEHSIKETMSNIEDLPQISKASPVLLNPKGPQYPLETKSITFSNGVTNKSNLRHDTADLTITPKDEALNRNAQTKPLDRHTIAGHRANRKKWKRRKLSETYIDVTLKGGLSFNTSPYPFRPPSLSSEDLLPNDPAFPILHRTTSLHSH